MAGITFFAAECMEFPKRLGVLHENLTLQEAVDAYRGICRRNSSFGPGIGFVLEDENIPDYFGREHPLVKQAVADMEPYLEKLGRNGKEERRTEHSGRAGR